MTTATPILAQPEQMAAINKHQPTGLEAPVLNSGIHVTGKMKGDLGRENKQRGKINQLQKSHEPDWWMLHNGLGCDFVCA